MDDLSRLVPIAATTLAFAAVLTAGCADHTGTGTPVPAPGAPTGNEPATNSVVVASGASYPNDSSIAEIPAEFVGVVTPIERVSDYWPDEPLQNRVWSRWTVRVDRAVAGPYKQGDTFVVANRGRLFEGGRYLLHCERRPRKVQLNPGPARRRNSSSTPTSRALRSGGANWCCCGSTRPCSGARRSGSRSP